MPGFARADCHGDGTPIRPGASGTKAAPDVLPDVLRYRLSADLQAPNFGSKRESGADLPRMQGPAQRHGVDRGTLARVPATAASWTARRRMRAQSEYIKVRSVVDDRAESAGAQQVVATGPQIPQAQIGGTIQPAVQVPFEHRREQAGAPDETAERVLGSTVGVAF